MVARLKLTLEPFEHAARSIHQPPAGEVEGRHALVAQFDISVAPVDGPVPIPIARGLQQQLVEPQPRR